MDRCIRIHRETLVVDIGCGGGRFDLMMARSTPRRTFWASTYAPLVERGNKWGEYAGVVDNLHFAECNATVSMGKWLKSYAEDCGSKVETVAIQFPDPHFKKRHHKRRVVQPALVRALAEGLTPGARVFLQSDVKDVSEDMRDKFEKFGAHLFDLDASLHDTSSEDAELLKANAKSAVDGGGGVRGGREGPAQARKAEKEDTRDDARMRRSLTARMRRIKPRRHPRRLRRKPMTRVTAGDPLGRRRGTAKVGSTRTRWGAHGARGADDVDQREVLPSHAGQEQHDRVSSVELRTKSLQSE